MVRLFGRVYDNRVKDNTLITVFEIPAFSKRGARERAKGNARVKQLEGYNIESIERAEDGSLPKQGIYRVAVTSSV